MRTAWDSVDSWRLCDDIWRYLDLYFGEQLPVVDENLEKLGFVKWFYNFMNM